MHLTDIRALSAHVWASCRQISVIKVFTAADLTDDLKFTLAYRKTHKKGNRHGASTLPLTISTSLGMKLMSS